MDETLPQLWDLASAHSAAERDDWDLAAELGDAEAGQVTLADRLSGSCGTPARVVLRDGTALSGQLVRTLSDGLVLVTDEGAVVVPFAGVRTATVTPGTPDLRQPGDHHLGVLSECRDAVGARVVVSLAGGASLAGELVTVAADHLVIGSGGDRVVVPLPALLALRRR